MERINDVILPVWCIFRVAALPATIDCLDDMNISQRLTRLIAPLGAAINLDGLAITEVMAAIFVADYNGITLSAVDVVIIA